MNMCIFPVYIPNPNKGKPKTGFNVLKDCTSDFISVPCGHCAQCIAVKQLSLIQRVQMESLISYLFFIVLTYNEDSLPIFSVGDFNLRFADIGDVQKMFKRLRKNNSLSRPFRYICVSELGGKRGRPHFHIILSVPKFESDDKYTPFNLEKKFYKIFLDEWRRNYGSTRMPIYKPLCTFVRKFIHGRMSYNYDCHYISPNISHGGVADPAFYCLKYILKRSSREIRLQQALHLNYPEEVYQLIWKTIKSKHVFSKGFGLTSLTSEDMPNFSRKIDKFSISPKIRDHIRKGIDFSFGKFPYPVYIHPDTGQTFPLSNFYKHYFLTVDDAFRFYMENLNNSPYVDSVADRDLVALNETLAVINRYNEQCKTLDLKEYF